jgi:biotin-dependent carboxylase-like uncharacterized protein
MIKVIKSGVYSSIQDFGRIGYAKFGVPLSGVMDSYSASLSNQLLNNNLQEAVLEITFGGCQLQFDKATQISITGADFSPKINGYPVAMNSIVDVEEDSILTFGKRAFGVRTYVAVLGGIQSEEVLKSKSFYKGISTIYLLKNGDVIPYHTNNFIEKEKFSKIKIDSNHFSSNTIICAKGAEFSLLSIAQQKNLTATKFTISNDNNRVGYRLEELFKNNLKPILTSGVLAGTVQLTPSGKLIVLMRDCQVTGGYPRILQISEKGINKLAQKTTGDTVRFCINE